MKTILSVLGLVLVSYLIARIFGYSHEEVLDYVYLASLALSETVGNWVEQWFESDPDFSSLDEDVLTLLSEAGYLDD